MDYFEGEDLVVWLVNVKESQQQAWDFIDGADIAVPCLMDEEGEFYDGYARPPSSGPFPLDVVVDRDGRITYLSGDYDAPALRAAIEAALAAPVSSAPGDPPE